jgi:hypothetical protein
MAGRAFCWADHIQQQHEQQRRRRRQQQQQARQGQGQGRLRLGRQGMARLAGHAAGDGAGGAEAGLAALPQVPGVLQLQLMLEECQALKH